MKYSFIFTVMKIPVLLLFAFVCGKLAAQEQEKKPFSLEADYFYGTILEHNPDIGHLITGHPEGLIFTYNRKTYGYNEWERRYNYPDWGFTFTYQDLKNTYLGEAYGVYSHMNWYFFNRHLVLGVAQGVAVATNPYDKETNFRNNAYGSRFMSSTLLKMYFQKDNIIDGLGLNAGLSLLHYSNANVKAPNTSTNTFAFNVGLNYLFDHKDFPEYIPLEEKERYSEPVKFNFVFRSGINESDVIGMGQYPFYIFSFYADKKISRKSTLQAGTEVFFSQFLKELIYYRSVAYPEDNISGDEDYKRVGVFLGYELRFYKTAFVGQLGYYAYYPYDFEGRVYNRLGLKRYFGEKERIFGVISLKAHVAKAEAIEFGVGIRL